MRKEISRLVLLLLVIANAVCVASENTDSAEIRGGVIVHLGCSDGRQTAELYTGDRCRVHGLDVDPANIRQAREHIQSLGVYGDVAVDKFDGAHLPYVDNMVNTLVADSLGDVPKDEVMRVLVPGGVALIDGERTVKPWPMDIDDWTHYLHDADNNAVADDSVVGPPRGLQWQAGPKWTRHHDRMSSFSGLVSTGGRLFYIVDEGSTASIYTPSHWALIARDAFNGKVLWKRPIDSWFTRFKGLKDGPADAPRRLVAVGNRVYATLSLHGPVTALDTCTGETIHEYEETDGAEEILFSDGELFVLAGPGSLVDGMRVQRPVEQRAIIALDAASGAKRWRSTDVVAAMTMAVDKNGVYYLNFDKKTVVGLDRGTGKVNWTSATVPVPTRQTSYFASKLVVRDGVVLLASGEHSGLTKSGGGETRSDTLTAVSTETGQTLWTAEHPPSGYSSPEDLFVIDGIVWCPSSSNGRLDGTLIGRELKTGAVKHEFPADEENYWFHHRCYSGRATSNYILTSRTGIEFIDFRKQHWDLNHWVRGACLYGIMPCNGLVYTPPAPCICYAETMLHSFNSFNPTGGRDASVPTTTPIQRLERGPAFGDQASGDGATGKPGGDWPTYRGANDRSGVTGAEVSPNVSPKWKTELGGRLSSVVVADGRAFVAAVDRHTLHALDAGNGEKLWKFTTGGRIDSPPTYFDGRVLFGSADGYVYCLRAEDGVLAWRFQAAAADRRILSYEQVESLWPVHGNVLVQDGVAHFVAGRSAFVDGGMRLYRLDARSGKLLSKTVLDDRNPATGNSVQETVQWLNMAVGRPDILSCDGERIYMRSQAFDMLGERLRMRPKTDGAAEGSMQGGEETHLFCPTGFLDDTWFHRTYWLYGSVWGSGWNGYYVAGQYAPAGKMMCVSDDTAYVFGRQPQYYKWTTPMEYRLFAANKHWTATGTDSPSKNGRRGLTGPVRNETNYRWSTAVPILVRAMTLAGPTLFVAGPRDVLDESTLRAGVGDQQEAVLQQEQALAGRSGAALWAVSAKDGEKLAEFTLDAPPVFDGMAAAGGRLYLTTVDGHVQCLGP